MVIKKAKIWAHDYDNITIVQGTWQKVLSKLGTFDEIFFDDFPLKVPENELEKKLTSERIHMFLDIIKYNHSKPITKVSAYIHDPDSTFKERINTRQDCTYQEYHFNIDIPNNCNYYRDTKTIIPVITF